MPRIRQPIVSVLAHVDHGKCVVPETLIPLTNGRLLTAKEIFDNYSKGGIEKKVEDGVAVEVENGPEIFTFDGKSTVKKKITHLWKLQSPGKLVKVRLRSGDEITTTPEHPFMVIDSNLNVGYKKAEEIQNGEFVIVPGDLKFESSLGKAKEHVIKALEKAENFVVFLDEKKTEGFFKRLLAKDNLQALQRKGFFTTGPYECRKQKRFRSKDFITLAKYAGFSALEMYGLIGKIKNATPKWRAGHTSNPMSLPKIESDFEKLGYVLGCMAGDGYVKGGLLNNNDLEIQSAYQACISDIFDIEGKVVQGHTCQLIRTNGGLTYSRFLTDVMDFPKENKSALVSLPPIARIYKPVFIGFVEGWFDTDGYVSPLNNSIEITSKSISIVKQVGCMLLSCGIHSVICEKNGYYTLRIANKKYLERFICTFNPKLERKKQRILDAVKKSTTSRVFDMTPLSGAAFKELKIECSNQDLAYFNRYKKYTLLSRAFLEQVLKHARKKDDVSKIKGLLNDELSYVKVVSKEAIEKKSDYVYDFTVPETHNFVAERIFVHNTTLLDRIRHTRVAAGEAGGITQHIGASEVPAKKIVELSGKLLEKFKVDLKIPGLLFIDTPGHAAFDLLRKRGGLLADIAILVIDINEGVMPQTEECIQILKSYKTPFVVAANKIDRLQGWQAKKDSPFAETFAAQRTSVQEALDKKIYELVGALYERGIQSERYDRVSDFTKSVAIIPISAVTGEGVPDLIALISGLSQRFLKTQLEVSENALGKGIVLEVKPTTGLGTTLDAILYDGTMRLGDFLVIGHPDGAIKTKVKALLKTEPLKEIRTERKFVPIKEISAAAGVKISAPEIENVIAGVPFIALVNESGVAEAETEVQKEIEEVEIKTGDEGVIVKADALGSLEAAVKLMRGKNIPIRRAEVGHVTRKDILSLEEVKEEHRLIFAFNTPVLPDAEELAKAKKLPIFSSNIIYRLIEDYEAHAKKVAADKKVSILGTITRASKIRLMPGYVFRQSKPAVGGFEVLGGVLRAGAKLMKQDGSYLGEVMAVQDKGENIPEATINMQVAVSIEGATIGRNLKEGDTLFSEISKPEYHTLRKQSAILSENERNVLDELREIMIKKDRLWDVEG